MQFSIILKFLYSSITIDKADMYFTGMNEVKQNSDIIDAGDTIFKQCIKQSIMSQSEIQTDKPWLSLEHVEKNLIKLEYSVIIG